MRKKVYIAAPWVKGGDARKIGDELIKKGFFVTSRWLQKATNKNLKYDYMKDPKYTPKYGELEAITDIMDVRLADYVLVLNTAKSEGKAFEQGLAFAYKKPIILLQKRTNTFHYLGEPYLYFAKTLKQAIKIMRTI